MPLHAFYRSRLVGGILLALACVGLPCPAAAQLNPIGFGGSPYDYRYAPTTVVVPDYSLLRVGEQFYPPTVRGLQELCAGQPQLCGDPGMAAEMARLQRQTRASNAALLGSVVGMLGGTGLLFWYLAEGDAGPAKAIAGGSIFGAGLVAGVVGTLVRPGRDEVRSVVNTINRSHHDTPVQWGLMLAPWGRRGLVGGLAVAF